MNYVHQRLSLMMFLQFFIWGSWFVTLGAFLSNNLGATGAQTGMAFSTQSWGAIVAPFFIGLIADRYFNAERVLGLLHILGAVLMYQLCRAEDFDSFYPFVLMYMIIYMPTLALVNVIAFRQISDTAAEFSKIRVWGTVGWIMAGLAISYGFSWDSQQAVIDGHLRNTFLMSGFASLLLGLFSFTLPKTPPMAVDKADMSLGKILGADAFKLLADKNFAIFFAASVLICVPLAFYYQNASPFLIEIGVSNPTGKMTLGQVSEVVFMLLLPLCLSRFGIKMTLLIGMLAWVLRYVLFALGDADGLAFMLVIGIALHGICYDFFFVAGQIYTDSKAGEHYRTAAQGMITLATYGVGMLAGFSVAGYISDMYAGESIERWQSIWLFPALFAVVVTVIFVLGFKDDLADSSQVKAVEV